MKRVLIINSVAIGENSGTGITLQNLWSGYPASDLLQLIITPLDVERNTNIPTTHTPVAFCRLPYSILYMRKRGAKETGMVLNAGIVQINTRSKIHSFIRGIFDSWPIKFKVIKDKIDEFKPEVIYTCGASLRIMKTVDKIAGVYNIPVVLHLMDDWPETVYTSSILTKPFHKISNKYLSKLAKMDGTNYAISTGLANKYQKLFHVPFFMLMNPAMNVAKDIKRDYSDPIRFVYTGSLSLNRWKSLLSIAELLFIKRSNGFKNEFDLYVPDNANTEDMNAEFKKFGASLRKYVPWSELHKIYENSDVMVFTESFDDNVIGFIKYSLSTKIPEYMATGRLLLAYLPKQLYSYKYIKEKQIGLVASDQCELITAIDTIYDQRDVCLQIQNQALDEVLSTHSKDVVIENFYHSFNK